MKDKIVNEQKNNTNKTPPTKSQLPNPKAKTITSSGTSKFNILGAISLAAVIAATGFFQYRVELLYAKNSTLEKHLSLLTEQIQKQSHQDGQLTERLAQSSTQLISMGGQLAFMQQTLNQIPGARLEDWKLAETEYLLRLANQRINLQKEVSGAAALLDSANQIIANLDDPALLVVREKISEEMLMLGNANEIDIQGIYSQLQALKALIKNDIQPPTSFTQTDLSTIKNHIKVEAQQTESSIRLVDKLLALVSIRTREGVFDAPLSVEQYQLLEHSLLLMLEQAQWALLKGDQTLYVASLSNAQNWIENKLRHKQADNLLTNIKTLKSLTIKTKLPDISGSLRVLRQILKDRTYAPSAIKLDETNKTNATTIDVAPTDSKENTTPETVIKNEVKQEQA
jgi:uroporphyrin-3 C-methyltransferase